MLTRDRVTNQQGIALLGAMIVVLMVSLFGVTLLNLAGQEAMSAGAGRQIAVTQQLADAAAELAVTWFHSPGTATQFPQVASLHIKRNRTVEGAPSYFSPAGQSQFRGTADKPDLRLSADNPAEDYVLNHLELGLARNIQRLGSIEELKLYAPSNPGLLCTIDATVKSAADPALRQSIRVQLGALDIPALRAAVQVGQNLGQLQGGSESPISVHWGDVKVGGNLVLRTVQDIPLKSAIAPVTGHSYDETTQREDRWGETWVGGMIQLTHMSMGETPAFPLNVHPSQNPVPGMHLDQWNYEQMKRIAKRFGRYYGIDRDGLLYPQGVMEVGKGLSPDDVFRSQGSGDQQGLVFIDTLDQTAPRLDNRGVVRLGVPYFEGTVVVAGHILLAPNGTGQQVKVLSPPQADGTSQVSRTPLQLRDIHLNGTLYATGDLLLTGKVRVYGALSVGGTITPSNMGGQLEVWYDYDIGQGLYRGLPVVYRAPGTWQVGS